MSIHSTLCEKALPYRSGLLLVHYITAFFVDYYVSYFLIDHIFQSLEDLLWHHPSFNLILTLE